MTVDIIEYFKDDRIKSIGNVIPIDWIEYEIGLAELNGLIPKYIEFLTSKQKFHNDCDSAIAYLIGLTDEIPKNKIKTSSATLPDIDIDFGVNGRYKIFDYLKGKYGEKSTAGISTYNTMGSKSAIRNVGRVLGYPIEFVNEIIKLVPDAYQGKSYTIDEIFDKSNIFKSLYIENQDVAKIIDIAKKLEGLIQARGQHAAGIVIADCELSKLISCITNSDDLPVVEIDKDDAEKVGLVKFDILGLETLDILNETCKLIREEKKVDIDLDAIDFNDPNIYETASNGILCGVFQFDKSEMIDYTSRFKPKNIDEISFLTSVNRPGPQAFKEQMLLSRFDEKRKPIYEIDYLNEVLSSTGGYLIYQEQAISLVKKLCNYNGKEAENFRKIIGKKKVDQMIKEKEKFILRGIGGGYNEAYLESLWKLIEEFGSYAFNAAHAYAYSYITIQCLYLKTYYYNEFLLSSIKSNMSDPTKTFFFLEEARKLNLGIELPYINECGYNFCIKNDKIILGLGFIKGFSDKTSNLIIKERLDNGPFKSFTDFYLRTCSYLSSNHYHSLIELGAFDKFNINRNTLKSLYDSFDKLVKKNIFNVIKSIDDWVYITKIENDFDYCEMLQLEHKHTGLYISDNLFNLINIPKKTNERLGIVVSRSIVKTKKGQLMAFVDVLTSENSIENLVVFPNSYSKYSSCFIKDNIIKYSGKHDEQNQFIVFKAEEIKELKSKSTIPPIILPANIPHLTSLITNSDIKKFSIDFSTFYVDITLY